LKLDIIKYTTPPKMILHTSRMYNILDSKEYNILQSWRVANFIKQSHLIHQRSESD